MTTCAAAIKKFEERTGETASDSKIVKLYCQIPPISKLDSNLNNLAGCEHLQLSTNNIDKIGVAFTGLKNLKILSMGRNVIKKIEKLDDLGDTLEQLWMSSARPRGHRVPLARSAATPRPWRGAFGGRVQRRTKETNRAPGRDSSIEKGTAAPRRDATTAAAAPRKRDARVREPAPPRLSGTTRSRPWTAWRT